MTTYIWDALNRRTRRTLPLLMFEMYGYDAVGNMTSRDANNKLTSFIYNSRGDKLPQTDPSGYGSMLETGVIYEGSVMMTFRAGTIADARV